jgi:hypothetical protein
LVHAIFFEHGRNDRLDLPALKFARLHPAGVHDLHGNTLPPKILGPGQSGGVYSRVASQFSKHGSRRAIKKILHLLLLLPPPLLHFNPRSLGSYSATEGLALPA